MRLGTWDLIKGYTECDDTDITPRFAMQIINEAALCQNRIRKNNYINSQGFELLNGMPYLASDNQIHSFLDSHTVEQAIDLQDSLTIIRNNRGHYEGDIIAIDPHRIISSTKRITPMKRKQPTKPAQKMIQTFFCNSTNSGQPFGFGIGSTAKNTTEATKELLKRINKIKHNALLVADKEHFTHNLFKDVEDNYSFELLVPAISSERIRRIEKKLKYEKLWAGFAVAETNFNFSGKKEKYRLIVQREGETPRSYTYKSFVAISKRPAVELITESYKERWSIEEFFNFDGAMGFDRASTLNLNVRYNKMSLALIAQAANHEFRKKLPKPYKKWNAEHLANAVFGNIDGDIRVVDDTIIVTCYNAPKDLNLQKNYQNLPRKLINEGINPKIPWLFDFKLDFRFK